MNKYIISKDELIGCWVLWELHRNHKIDIFHGKNKKECIAKLNEMSNNNVNDKS